MSGTERQTVGGFPRFILRRYPYGQPTIGWTSDIENLSRTEAESFLHRYYAPNNAVMAIIGDIDAAKTIQLVEKYFAPSRRAKTVSPWRLWNRNSQSAYKL
jgi:predicted Zn-dependent peptidase